MKQDRKHLAALLGAGLVSTLSATPLHAQQSPFALKELNPSTNNRLAEAAPAAGSAADEAGKAAEKMKGATEMKCGAQMMKKDPKAPAVEEAGGTQQKGAAPGTPAAPQTTSP
ncbi:MAG: hypothetical protein MUF20_07100 [Methylotetracoccus sp.]|jgi:uncharacterized low-complexity protein|nr:hypothetical protein [Methylotetracoccus sp.]